PATSTRSLTRSIAAGSRTSCSAAARKVGADAFRGWRVQDVLLAAERHTILMSQEDEECIATARWVVDVPRLERARGHAVRGSVGAAQALVPYIQDGLYADDGISLAQALEMLPGIEEMDLEKRGAVVAA